MPEPTRPSRPVPPPHRRPRGPRAAVATLAPFVLIAAASTGIAAGLVGFAAPVTTDEVAEFDHSAHIERGLECGDCHLGVAEGEEAARAGVPSVAICAELCHEDLDDETVARIGRTEHGRMLLHALESGEELWWPQAWYLPPDVVFSHRRHVAIGAVECARCHGDIESATVLPRVPVEGSTTMDGCIDCHDAEGASTDCFACHS